MKHIKLEKKLNDENWSKRFVDKKDFHTLYNESVSVTKPDGEPLMVLLKGAIPKDVNALAWAALKDYKERTTNRGTATGIATAPRKKKDGTISKVQIVPKGWEVISGVVGYFERTARSPFCHACTWNASNPEKYSKLRPLVELVSSLYKQHVPKRWEIQKSFVDRTPPEYVIGNSVYTTLTINKNFRTACHKDAGDLEAGFSCLSVITEGKFLGGELVLPNWGIAAKLETGDLIMFDAHEFHGNTQIIPLTKKYQRCSIVYYYREMMQYCQPIEVEIERAKNRKEGDPLFPEKK